MKRTILLFAVLLTFASCEKPPSRTEEETPEPTPTTYTFSTKDDMVAAFEARYKGFTFDIDFGLLEYKGRQCVATNKVGNPKKDKKYSFVPKAQAEYVVVSMTVTGTDTGNGKEMTPPTKYVASAYYLTAGEDTPIVIGSDTYLTNVLPLSD